MATKKAAVKKSAPAKKAAVKKAAVPPPPKKDPVKRRGSSKDIPDAQAWENGKSVACAKDTSE